MPTKLRVGAMTTVLAVLAFSAALISPLPLPAGDAAGATPGVVAFSLGGPLSSGGQKIAATLPLGPSAVGLAFGFVLSINNDGQPGSAAIDVPPATVTVGSDHGYATSNSAGLQSAAVTGISGGPTCSGATLAVGQFCDIGLVVLPLKAGTESGTVHFGGNLPSFSFTVVGDEGYVTATEGAAGAFFDTYGASKGSDLQPTFVDQDERQLNAPIVGAVATQTGDGYYLAAADGGVFNFGDATFHGSAGSYHLNQPIVGLAGHPSPGSFSDGGVDGYWLVAADGGIFTFGDAAFYGSAGSYHLNKPIVGMAATPDGKGYWLVASDGGIFAFGDAGFHGSTGGIHLNEPIIGMAATPDGGGYWLEARDAGSFTEGDAPYLQEGFTSPGLSTVTIAPFGDPVPPGLSVASVGSSSGGPGALAWQGAGVHTPA